jgi:hypothetical protein
LAILPKQIVSNAIQDTILVTEILLIPLIEIASIACQDVFHVLDMKPVMFVPLGGI